MPPPGSGPAGEGFPRLYLITDRRQVPGGDLFACLQRALQGGARLVQLREKDLEARAFLELAVRAVALCRAAGARLLINGRADVALAVGADGVHLTSTDPPVAEVRALLGPQALIGVSAHHVDEVVRAETEGASFVTFGPVYDTPSKRGMGKPVGIGRLRDAVYAGGVPVFALGGVHLEQLPAVLGTGCHGVAVISEVMASRQPEQAVARMLDALRQRHP